MGKLFTLLCLTAMSMTAFSQYYYIPYTNNPGNPGGLNQDGEYPVGGGLPAGWSSILPGANATAAWSSTVTLPFTFNFNGSPVTSYKVSSSGVLTFTTGATTAPGYTNAAIPDAAIPDASIMVWGVKGTGANDEIVHKTFGTAPNRQHWVMFSSYTDDPGNGWAYWAIMLEETTDNIYIVEQRHSATNNISLTAGVQIDGTEAYSVQGSPNLNNLAGSNSAFDDDNSYYKFIFGTQPQFDLDPEDITVSPWLVLGSAPFTITGNVTNLGSATVSSYDLNYSIDGGAAVTQSMSPASFTTYSTVGFSHPTAWNPASTGTYNVKVWTSNVNGNADQNVLNDTVEMDIQVVNAITTRRPLVEDFGSNTCPPCATLAVTFDPLLIANGANAGATGVSAIKYQMNWPAPGTDPFYNPDAFARRQYYAVNAIPSTWGDGGLATSENQAWLNSLMAQPSFMNINATYYTYGNTVGVEVEVDPLADYTETDLVLHIAVVEDYVDESSSATFSSTLPTTTQDDYYQIQRKLLPDASGTAIGPLTAGNSVNVTEMYTFTMGNPQQGNYNIETSLQNISVVAWVQDVSSKEIHQSVVASFAVGTDDIAAGLVQAKLFPNPAAERATLRINLEESADLSVEVFNAVGQRVHNINKGVTPAGETQLQLQTADWASGIYMVHITANGLTTTKKLTVQ